MENNKATVTIYGEEYVIAGEKSHEDIIKVGTHVDSKMQEIGQGYKGPTSKLAVLASVNIAAEYFALFDRLSELEKLNEQLEGDTQHYEQLWEEAKKSFVSYKEESQSELAALKEKSEILTAELNEKNREIEELIKSQKDMEMQAQKGSEKAVSNMKKDYKELENNFFDLQMENIQLKSEVEKLKNNLERERNEQQGY